ncbi:MAG: glycoside hydrolase family 30 beta sandwich domain-containing protein, partial [Bacteroidaceae bacterium]
RSSISFLNPDSTVATLLINNNNEDKAVSIVKEEGVVANVKIPGKSVMSVLMGPADLVPAKKNAYYAQY